jgi:signal transduction histidine kinase
MISNLRRIEQTERTIKTNHERLQRLSAQLIMGQEAERRRIARELHDELGQSLSALKINLQTMGRLTAADHITRRLDDSIEIVDRAIHHVRTLAVDLRPAILDDLGLAPALRWCIDRHAWRWGVQIEFIADLPKSRMPHQIEITCFRVTQEILTNIGRHARATRVWVELRMHNGALELRITDDGSGFDVAAVRSYAANGSGSGLLGMEERVRLVGGRFHIDSAANQGTVVYAYFPIPV